MAFVQSPLPPEQQNQLGPQGQTTPNPLALLPPQAAQTGGSVGQGGGSSAPTAPGVGSSTQFGSNASRLSDYLQANQDQTQAMANQIAGQMGTNLGGLKSSIDTAGTTFGQSVAGGYTPLDPTLVGNVQANPTAAAANPQNVSEFQSLLNDQYTGPASFEGSQPYADVQKNVQNAVQNAQAIGTYPGLSTYLQNNIETNPTQGQNTLDTTLLEANMPAWQTIQSAATPYSNLPGYLANETTAQDAAIQSAQQAAPAAAQAAQGAWNTAGTNLSNTVAQELAQAEQGYTQGQTGLNKYIAALQKPGLSGLTTFQQQMLGIDPTVMQEYIGAPTVQNEMTGEWNSLPALSPLRPGANDFTFPTIGPGPNAANTATPADYATLAALTSLSGGKAPMNAPISAANAAQGGTYTPQNFNPTPNNKALAQDLYNQMNPWTTANFGTLTPTGNPGGALGAEHDYYTMMNTLAQYLGLPPVVTNAPPSPAPPPQPPTTGGGGPGTGLGGTGGAGV